MGEMIGGECGELDWLDCGPDEMFIVQVSDPGEGSVDEHIQGGDHIVLKRRGFSEDGKIYLVRDDAGREALSRIYREGERYRLEPGTASGKPVYRDRVEVLGILVGLVRKY